MGVPLKRPESGSVLTPAAPLDELEPDELEEPDEPLEPEGAPVTAVLIFAIGVGDGLVHASYANQRPRPISAGKTASTLPPPFGRVDSFGGAWQLRFVSSSHLLRDDVTENSTDHEGHRDVSLCHVKILS
jgi:hypothetical protein